MKLKAIAICESVITDSRTNKLTMINLIEAAVPVSLPFGFPQVAIVVILSKSPKDNSRIEGKISLKIPGAEDVLIPVVADFQSLKDARIVAEVQGIVIHSPGTMVARVYFEDKLFGSWSAEISRPKPPS
jgi:hypothetical protein